MGTLNKKIKAFTIAELLVTLVVSSLVIGLAMLILNLINKQLGIINKNTGTTTEIRLLEKALWQDFNTHHVFFNAKQNQLQAISEIDTVNYEMNEIYVIRNQDTLNVPVFKINSYLEGNLTTNGTIDALELQLTENSIAPSIFIYKTNDASFYMNTNGL